MASPPESTVHNDQTNLGGPSCRQFCTIITSKGKTHMRGRAGSGLVLAGANTWLAGGTLPVAAEDGVITSLDVIGLDLAGTALVVLSACETGLGVMEAGEGVLGLRRAFLLAGASTVVVSLWKVADQATTTLMDEFYRRLLIGEFSRCLAPCETSPSCSRVRGSGLLGRLRLPRRPSGLILNVVIELEHQPIAIS